MTTHFREAIVCECGHSGTLRWSENDQPFSKQWEQYSVDGFEGEGFYIEGYTSPTEALRRINPRCLGCGAVGKVSRA
jgi:hypothetical protein